MKKRVFLVLILCSISIYSQEAVDIVTPEQSPFNLGQDISGLAQGSINEPTGKATLSIPISSLNVRTISYDVSLIYNGQSAFDMASNTNRYNPTNIIGVGFGMFTPKIVVNNKNTAVKEDDEFYIQDGANNTKLYCTDRIEPNPLQTGEVIWEFGAENYVPWKIRYYKSLKEFVNGVLTETPLDYWIITNQDGVEFFYGQTQNSKENVVTWGNWIGNSNKSGGNKETIIWNISTIRDQWNNNIQFEYELQESTVGGVAQTEASYIKKITASTGENIRFAYTDKNANEIYEPNIEYPEPDAYQERYEKKYLQQITSYNSSNQLIYNYNLTYSLVNNSSASDQKRYLTSITQENAQGEFLPSQKFEYYTSGTFKGGVKKITYPTGGSVSYEYKNKLLFSNSANRFSGPDPYNDRFNYYSMVTRDKYALKLYKYKVPVNGKYSFQLVRHFWNGQSWDRDLFNFPYDIVDTYPATGPWLENFHVVFGGDFYAFLYQEGSNGKLDLFHLNPDGKTWDHKTYNFVSIGSGAPKLMHGDKFVAIGSYNNGKLHTFTWDGDRWINKTIQQGSGEYFYGAANNFILTLNEKNTGSDLDFITGENREDYYYIHYLDITNQWVSKSWSAAADPYIAGIEKPSYFYPENSMSGFVPDDNPELFLRWDTNYNLLPPDNDVLGAFLDASPLISTYTGMYTLQNHFYQYSLKYARFNGVDWKTYALPVSAAYYAKPFYGEDISTFQNHGDIDYVGFVKYDPNIDLWQHSTGLNSYPSYLTNSKVSGITNDFIIASNKVYIRNNTSRFAQTVNILNYDNVFTHTDGLSHGFVELGSGSHIPLTSRYYYFDKASNQLASVDMGARFHMYGPTSFAGRTPFMSPTSIWLRSNSNNNSFNSYLHRVINDKVNNSVYDIVIDKVKIDNGDGEIRETIYSYNSPNSTSDNETTFYGDVILENKGYGTASIGVIEKKFKNGSSDLQMAGLLEEQRIKDINGNTVSLQTNTWTKYKPSSRSYISQLTKQENEVTYNDKVITTVTSNSYGTPHYLLTNRNKISSKGQTESTQTKYAVDYYPFMEVGNYVSQPYEIISKVNGKVVSVDRTIWKKDANNKIYASEVWSGTSLVSLRKTREVSKMNNYGQIIETTNGRGQYNSILFGYNYRYPIASISNAEYDYVIGKLETSLLSLQNMDNETLKIQLLKLYNELPETMIDISLYDIEGKVVKKINQRQEEMSYYYDSFNRLDYTTDLNNKVLEKNIYNYKTN
ncbi:hypothetical protein [uncultured Aquimarina sp.]|uniref:hypothetical protein n=1 Tax=uncultured Aquimarina sp. TaxID=575652 RepID=UPI0026186A0D|nr:hypothetical protein [uncultured Aquimarina sp.]